MIRPASRAPIPSGRGLQAVARVDWWTGDGGGGAGALNYLMVEDLRKKSRDQYGARGMLVRINRVKVI